MIVDVTEVKEKWIEEWIKISYFMTKFCDQKKCGKMAKNLDPANDYLPGWSTTLLLSAHSLILISGFMTNLFVTR